MSRPDRSDEYLITKGVMSLALGYSYAIIHVPHSTRNSLSTVTGVIPLWVYGLAWIATGTYCIFAGYTHRKISGFTVVVFMPWVWGLMYLVCWANGDPGRGWVFTVIFWSIARAAYKASGMIDPRSLLHRRQAGQ